MFGDLRVSDRLTIPADELGWRFSRSSGPGGQGVNTTDSRVELVVDLTAVTGPGEAAERVRERFGPSLRIVAAAERSQLRNREAALRRLADRLDAAARPRRRRTATRPTRASVRRRLEAKKRRAQIKARRRGPEPDRD